MPLTDQEILDRVEGQTVPTAFMATLAEHSDLVAVRWMSEGDWFQLSFAEFAERGATAAASPVSAAHSRRTPLRRSPNSSMRCSSPQCGHGR